MIRSGNFTPVWRPHNQNRKAARLVDRHHAGLTQSEREHRKDRLKGALWRQLPASGLSRSAYRDWDPVWRDSYDRWDDNSGFWPGDVGNMFRDEKGPAGKAVFSMREPRKRFLRFWPFATKSDIRAAEDRTKWRDTFPLADRFNSPV